MATKRSEGPIEDAWITQIKDRVAIFVVSLDNIYSRVLDHNVYLLEFGSYDIDDDAWFNALESEWTQERWHRVQ